MPLTPFHMGPGILLKGLLQGSFSLMVFGWAQIVMDIQPLVAMLSGHGHLHGLTHTYVGASVLAVLSAISGKYLAAFALRVIGRAEFLPIGWTVAFVSAAIGTFSHVALDSLMHPDIEPLWPLSSANVLLGVISVGTLHWLCIGSGVVGTVLYFVLAGKRAWRH